MHANGDGGLPVDMSAAIALYRAAAEQGDAEAQYNLGVSYGQGEGVEENEELAVVWCAKAATQGHEAAAEVLAALQELDDDAAAAEEKEAEEEDEGGQIRLVGSDDADE